MLDAKVLPKKSAAKSELPTLSNTYQLLPPLLDAFTDFAFAPNLGIAVTAHFPF